MLVEFHSIVDAMRCATEWQSAMAEHAESRIAWRIGINLGDVIIDGDDIFGDGVNIAARLEALAEPGGICVAAVVQHALFLVGTALCSRRFEEAIPKFLLAIQSGGGAAGIYRWLAVSYAHLGRLDEARATIAQLRTMTSVVIQDAIGTRIPEHRELFLSGLRLAMGEEPAG